MNRKDEERLERLLESVEKEERRQEERMENPGAVRRQLFIDEPVIEPIDTLCSDDETEDHVEEQTEDAESEMSGDEEEIAVTVGPQYTGKNNITKWNVHCPPRNRRTASFNLVRRLPGVTPGTRPDSPLTAWKLFFTDEILEDILKYTNQRIDKIRPQYTRERDARPMTRDELKAFIGILYMAGVLHASHLNLYDLWSTDGTGVVFFRNCLNIQRFKFLIRALRFDDSQSRRQRRETDKLAPIRETFEKLVEKCKKNFSVSAYLTIDEMLESFRGRCPFRQYIKNKPAKYGIKIFAMTCAKTFYTINMEIYAGKQPQGPYDVENSGLAVVTRLVQPVSGTGRNITTDNWFTSVPLAERLLRDHNLTLVGTLRKNKAEIPPEFINTRGRPETSSIFGYSRQKTLMSYCPKKNRIVILLSTMHSTDEIDPESGDRNKPYMLTFYNSTKGGVDVVDEYKASYSVARTSNRWPLTVFFSLLNTIGLNSFILYKHAKGDFNIARRDYIKQLARELCRPYMLYRQTREELPRSLKRSIAEMLGIQREVRARVEEAGEGRCGLCDWKRNRKSKTRCNNCRKFICREHTVPSCSSCATEAATQSDNE